MSERGDLLKQLEMIGGAAFVPGRAEWIRASEEWQVHNQPIEVWVQNRTLDSKDAGLLAEVLKKVSHLTVLKLNCTGLSQAQIEGIKRAFPAVRVEVTNAT